MAMQTDVKSAHTNASAALVSGRVRLKGVVFTVSGGSPVDHIMFYDNASAASGTVRLELDSGHSGSLNVVILGEGILFTNGIYCDIGDAESVTIFYG